MRAKIGFVFLLLLSAFGMAGAGDVFQQLGKSKAALEQQITMSFADGYVPVSEVRDRVKAASPAMRAAMVEQVLAVTKAYVNSPAFAKSYAALREERKPAAPEAASADAMIKQQRDDAAKNIADIKKSMAGLSKEDRESWEGILAEATRQLKEFDSPQYREALQQQFAADRESYQEQLQQWNEQYPADPKAVVKLRLRELLEETKDVDYAAKLVTKGGKQRFANEDYEGRSSNWKLAYRAGKEPVAKARAFASAWLGELK